MISQYDFVRDERPRGNDCLVDADLLDLVNDALPESRQSEVVSHLDQCPDCRARLEETAGQVEQWKAVAEHLQNKTEPAADSRLHDTLRGLKDPTRHSNLPHPAEDPAPFDVEDKPRLSDRYEIVKELGRGGMGIVYLAVDQRLRRQVAIKLIRGPLTGDQAARDRIEREAIAAAAIRSPNVVAIHHIDHCPAGPFLVMEYIAGVSLEQRLHNEDRLSIEEVVRIGREIAAGLAAAHAGGLVHRDVKPANVLLEEGTGQVKLTDFGLVRGLDPTGLTQEDMISGTPEYIAPEQAAGREVDHRADLYSLGCVLYALCTGHPPFQGGSPLAILRRTQEEMPVPIQSLHAEVPSELCTVIERLLAKDPEARYQTANDVSEALQQLSTDCLPQVARSDSARTNVAWLVIALSLGAFFAAVGLGVSEAGGWTHFGQFLLAAAGDDNPQRSLVAKRDEDAKVKNKAAKRPKVNAPDVAPLDTTRVQVVTPEQVMRERIQNEKDSLPRDESPLLVRKLLGHTGPVQDFVFTPDGKQIISCSGWPSGDRTIRVWDLAKGKELRQFDTSEVPPNPGNSGGREAPREFAALAISPDGKKLVSASTGGAVCVWDVGSGKMIGQFKGHTGSVYALAISPDGTKVLSGGRDAIVRMWDLNTQAELMALHGEKSFVRVVTFSPDGTQALIGGMDNTLRLWDLNEAKLLKEMKSADRWVWDAKFSADGKRAISSCGQQIDLWDLSTGELIRSFRGHADNLTDIDWSPDGRMVISGGYDNMVRLWDVDSGKQIDALQGHRDWVWRVRFTPDGKQAVSSGGGRASRIGGAQPGIDFAIRVWNLPTLPPRVAKP
ncbi:protein kinase [bacterium]|nr:protein kinase [bacterium]